MDIDEEEEDMEADAATNEEEEEQEPEGEVSHSFLCPRHDNGRGIKCYPCPSVHMNVSLSKRRLLSESNTFDQNFMKLDHIV